MIVIKHTKLGNISYVSHVDCMRVLQRSLNRAGVKVAMSEGYNPHMLTYCSHPLPVGVASLAEYLVYKPFGDLAVKDIARLFDEATPHGIKAVAVYDLAQNPNVVGQVVACDYNIECNLSADDVARLKAFFAFSPNNIGIDKKGEIVMVDIAPMVISYSIDSQKISLRLQTGNPTLRADKLIDWLNSKILLGNKLMVTKTVRVAHLLKQNDKYITLDEFCEGVAK